MCGGTHCRKKQWIGYAGLSPRVRGNRSEWVVPGHGDRSIPACAGEPSTSGTAGAAAPVYPRVCGGTSGSGSPPEFMAGLSPRVRGNQVIGLKADGLVRSIPACAGEPGLSHFTAAANTVYPRVCGGTLHGPIRPNPAQGLSPRVRGNLNDGVVELNGGGSIPACAGEPICPTSTTRRPGVYPRVCGGTGFAMPVTINHIGLSPRVRGNPAGDILHQLLGGSIPACAGEPWSAGTTTRR